MNRINIEIRTKIIILIVSLALQIPVFGQEVFNSMTQESFDSVKFHSIYLKDLKETDGNQKELSSLVYMFENPLPQIEEYGGDIGEPERFLRYSNGLELTFDLGGVSERAELILLEGQKIELYNKELEIGDDVNTIEEEIFFNQQLNGKESVLFIRNEESCCPIVLELDSTRRITKIYYFVTP